MQVIKLTSFDETDIMMSVRDSWFDEDFETNSDIWYAFGISAYDSNQEAIEDPSIGTLNAYYKTWGLKEGASGIDFEPIPTRNCTKSEL